MADNEIKVNNLKGKWKYLNWLIVPFIVQLLIYVMRQVWRGLKFLGRWLTGSAQPVNQNVITPVPVSGKSGRNPEKPKKLERKSEVEAKDKEKEDLEFLKKEPASASAMIEYVEIANRRRNQLATTFVKKSEYKCKDGPWVSKIERDKLVERLYKCALDNAESAKLVLGSRLDHFLTKDQIVEVFKKHQELMDLLKKSMASNGETVPTWVKEYYLFVWPKINNEEQKIQTTGTQPSSSPSPAPLPSAFAHGSKPATPSSTAHLTQPEEKEIKAINLLAEFSDDEDVNFFERYVRAALKRAHSEVTKENEQKKVVNNLYAAALGSVDAAKLLLNHPSSLGEKLTLTSEQIKNILQIHRRIFVMEDTWHKDNDVVNQIREKYKKTIEEINEKNKEEARRIFLELKARNESGNFELGNYGAQIKLLLDYFESVPPKYNTNNKFLLNKICYRAMVDDIEMAKYILSNPTSVGLYYQMSEIFEIYSGVLITSPPETQEIIKIRELHKIEIGKICTKESISVWSAEAEHKHEVQQSEFKQSENEDELLSKACANVELAKRLLLKKNGLEDGAVKIILNRHRNILIIEESKELQTLEIRTKYKDCIDQLKKEYVSFLSKEPTAEYVYGSYLNAAYDYRRLEGFLNKIDKDTLASSLYKIALSDMELAKTILNSSLQSRLKKNPDQTREILNHYKIFKEGITDDPIILQIRNEYVDWFNEDQTQPTRGSKKPVSATASDPEKAKQEEQKKEQKSSIEAKSEGKKYLATGTYDPPHPGHILPHLEYIYNKWIKECEAATAAKKQPPAAPTIYFSPCHDDWQLHKRSDGRTGFSVEARVRQTEELIAKVYEAVPKYKDMTIKVHKWESSQPKFNEHYLVYKQVAAELHLTGRSGEAALIYLPGQDLYDNCCNCHHLDKDHKPVPGKNSYHKHMEIQFIPRASDKATVLEEAKGTAALACLSSSKLMKGELGIWELIALKEYGYIELMKTLKEEDISVPKKGQTADAYKQEQKERFKAFLEVIVRYEEMLTAHEKGLNKESKQLASFDFFGQKPEEKQQLSFLEQVQQLPDKIEFKSKKNELISVSKADVLYVLGGLKDNEHEKYATAAYNCRIYICEMPAPQTVKKAISANLIKATLSNFKAAVMILNSRLQPGYLGAEKTKEVITQHFEKFKELAKSDPNKCEWMRGYERLNKLLSAKASPKKK